MKDIKSILQGILFNKNKKRYEENFSGLLEGNQNINDEDDDESSIMELKSEYRGLINQWIEKYREHVSNKMTNNVDVSDILGKTVEYGGKNYFVTLDGTKREIPNYTGDADNHNCLPDDLTTIRTIESYKYNKLYNGSILNKRNVNGTDEYQKCSDSHVNTANRLIKNAATNKISWVDYKGYKHEFENPNLRHSSCNSDRSMLTIGNLDYDLIPKAPTNDNPILKENDKCIRTPESLEGDLAELNTQSTNKALEIMERINSLTGNSQQLENSIDTTQQNLDTSTTNLNNKRQQLKLLEREIHSLDSSIGNNKVSVDSINLKYVTWGVSLATVAVLTLLVSKK